MEYGRLLNRAWTIVWMHKFLILLGVLAVLGSGGNNSRWQVGDGTRNVLQPFYLGEDVFGGIPLVLITLIIGLVFAIGLVAWVVSTVARGGLIAAVDTIENGGQSTFRTAWLAGWQKVWPLLGIALLPAIPILLLLIVGVTTTGAWFGFAALAKINPDLFFRSGMGGTLIALACVAVPSALGLLLLSTFAERACMLENLGVFPAYRRAWKVLSQNLGPAILLFLIQIGLSILLGIAFAGPGIVIALCFLFWPILLVISGAAAAYFSALWTLAWREWNVGNTSSPLATSGAGL